MKKILLIMIMALTTSAVFSQSNSGELSLYAFYYEYDFEEPLINATVTLTGEGYSKEQATNEEGRTYFCELPAGYYTMTITKEDFQSRVIQNINVDSVGVFYLTTMMFKANRDTVDMIENETDNVSLNPTSLLIGYSFKGLGESDFYDYNKSFYNFNYGFNIIAPVQTFFNYGLDFSFGYTQSLLKKASLADVSDVKKIKTQGYFVNFTLFSRFNLNRFKEEHTYRPAAFLDLGVGVNLYYIERYKWIYENRMETERKIFDNNEMFAMGRLGWWFLAAKVQYDFKQLFDDNNERFFNKPQLTLGVEMLFGQPWFSHDKEVSLY